jgi:NADH dehydrogenase
MEGGYSFIYKPNQISTILCKEARPERSILERARRERALKIEMNKYFRRVMIGILAGAIGGVALLHAFDNSSVGFCLGVVVGVFYAVAFAKSLRATYADSMMTAASFGVPLWALVNIIALPLFAGEMPYWTATGMRAQFPALVGWALYGIVLGLLTPAFNDLAARVFGAEREPAPSRIEVKTRIVILGGGFAGVACAQYLERAFGADASIELTLVSETNALLFTPMLAEVAASSLEATHISTPLRSTLRRTRVVRGRVSGVDLAAHQVRLAPDAPVTASMLRETTKDAASADAPSLPYDHLVLAMGAVSNFLGMKNVETTAFDFKSLADAIRIRNHIIDCFERADAERDAQSRRTLVTFVVAGGGYAGAELAGGLNDFARGMLALYPNISDEEVRVILVHSRERILPEMSAGLAEYARTHMEQRGVTFKLKTRLKDARADAVVLDSGEEIATKTLVWTAGTAPNPLLQTLPVERDKRGAVVVNETLAVPGHAGLWAIGDCAMVPDPKTGKPCPPTAQFALREARTLALNIHAQVHGKFVKAFHFNSLGQLCVVGHQTACAEIKGLKFSGFLAWLMWRGIYLGKLPGLERKVRVLADWIIEVFFPRDIVQTIDMDTRRSDVGATDDEARVDETHRMSEAKGAYAGS